MHGTCIIKPLSLYDDILRLLTAAGKLEAQTWPTFQFRNRCKEIVVVKSNRNLALLVVVHAPLLLPRKSGRYIV